MTSDHQHSSPIKTPKQLVIVVVLAFAVPVLLIVLITQLVTSAHKGGSRSDQSDETRVLQRIQPVGTVVVADPNAPKGVLTGEQVYEQVCKTCHGAGIAGAPKVGDKAAWGPRLAQGDKVLFQHAIAGYQGKAGVMPPKGGNPDLADVEVERAVVYMANQSGGNLKEPPAPPATTQTAGSATVPAGSVGVATAAPGASPAPARERSSAAPGAPASPVPPAAPQQPAPAAAAAASGPGATAGATAAAGAKPDGKKVYEQTCAVCHGAGIAGAPKFGDKAAWAPRIAQGANVLYTHAIQGFQGKSGVMPPKGGNTTLPDADVKAAVDYMAAAAK